MTEKDVVDFKGITGFTIGLTVVAIAAHLAMLLMYRVLTNQVDASNPPRMFPLHPRPRLRSRPVQQRKRQPPPSCC